VALRRIGEGETGLSQLIYYVAVSADGFVAPPDGGLDWLAPYSTGSEDYGFREFYKTVDALIEGSKTYEQALTFNEWPHPGKPCWVVTNRIFESKHPEVRFTSAMPTELVRQVSAQGYKRVWLVGGSQLAGSFRAAGLITDYVLSIIPVFLGAGRKLFAGEGPPENLRLVESKWYPSGLVQVWYARAQQDAPGDAPTAARRYASALL
jgi:dihydrofolate reductase